MENALIKVSDVVKLLEKFEEETTSRGMKNLAILLGAVEDENDYGDEFLSGAIAESKVVMEMFGIAKEALLDCCNEKPEMRA